jgi:hypothetical protein
MRVLQALQGPPPAGGLWTGPKLRDWVERELGNRLSLIPHLPASARDPVRLAGAPPPPPEGGRGATQGPRPLSKHLSAHG